MTVRPSEFPKAISLLARFDRVQRAAHWTTALLFGILMLTALPLYFPALADLVGRRALLVEIHVWSGLVLPLPVLVSLVGPWGARMRRDLRRVNLWTRDEITWINRFGRRAPTVLDKFNPGQKLNTIFIGGSILVMLATGAILKWFQFFPVSWRTGATLVHDLLAFTIFVVVAGHIILALTHPQAMRSMITGRVTAGWAALHAPAWLREETGEPDPENPGPTADS